MEDLEYTQNELLNLSKTDLLKLADYYQLSIKKNISKKDLIKEILDFQNRLSKSRKVKSSKFNNLPADILRLLALYVNPGNICKFCRLSKKINTAICGNDRFMKELGHIYLTEHDERLTGNILEGLNLINIDDVAERGYEKKFKIMIEKESYRKSLIGGFLGAAENGHLDIIEHLVDLGFDIHFNHEFPLRIAAANGRLNVVKYLVEHNANIHTKHDEALARAITNGHLAIVDYLVSQGAVIHRALPLAAESNHLDIVKYLEPHSAVQDLNNALLWAISNNNLEMVKYLIEHDANVHYMEDLPLRQAAKLGYLDIVKYLVSRRADPSVIKKNDYKDYPEEIKEYIRTAKK